MAENTSQRDVIAQQSSALTRRGFLTAGAVVGGGALLASCSSGGSTSTSTSAASGKTSFKGVSLNVGCNPTDVQAAQAAGKLWGEKNGATVTAQVIPYAERATDYATMIVSQDPHWDVLFGSVNFVSNFGSRIYEDLGDLDGQTKDLIPAALGQLTKGGKLYAAPLFADMEFFIYNKSAWRDAGLDPAKVPTTWDELYALAPKLNAGGRVANATPWNTIGIAVLDQLLQLTRAGRCSTRTRASCCLTTTRR